MREKKQALRATIRAAVAKTSSRGDDSIGRCADHSQLLSAFRSGISVDQIESLSQFAAARTVALYHALPDEVSTDAMLVRWQGLKRLALPVITGDGEMVFREYIGGNDLGEGAFGIREPGRGREIPPFEIELMVVPGVAFDAAGRRLGRGKGFYDHYLSHSAAAHIYKVGLCHPRALVDEIPAEPHDVTMDKIIFGC